MCVCVYVWHCRVRAVKANIRSKKQTYHITIVTVIVIVTVTVTMSRDDVVGILARLQAGQPRNRVSIPAGRENFFLRGV
jgi:hypothetical protein